VGGVRGFVAEGATVITDDKNRNFFSLRCQPKAGEVHHQLPLHRQVNLISIWYKRS
jgi:hypothetical protein